MLFIINPTAARGRAARDWFDARKELQRSGISLTERFTTRPAEATEIARQALIYGEKTIVAVGGDGTLNEVINGYFDDHGLAHDTEAAIGLLPSGTGSDFRRSLGLLTRKDAIAALESHKTQMLDVVRVELQKRGCCPIMRYSINVISLGLGGDTATLVNSWRETWPRWLSGQVRFVVAALVSLNRYRNHHVRLLIDGQREFNIKSNFIVVANGRYAGGGMMLAPHAEFNDGLMDVVLTDGVTRLEIVKELPGIRRGAHLGNPKVIELRARQVAITSDNPLSVDIDGEPAGYTPACMSILPSALKFIVKSRS